MVKKKVTPDGIRFVSKGVDKDGKEIVIDEQKRQTDLLAVLEKRLLTISDPVAKEQLQSRIARIKKQLEDMK